MTENKWFEKRQDVRAEFTSPISARIAASGDSNDAQSQVPSLSSVSSYSDVQIPDLVPLLIQIDEKLNKVIRLLEGKDHENSLEVIETINISGSGMSMIMSGNIEKGQKIDLSLRLPDFPLGKFEVCAEVVRVKHGKEKHKGYLDVGVKFLNISQEGREALISYIFKQQRKMIRQSKTV